MRSFTYPKVVLTKNQKVYLDLKLNSQRLRIWNGSKFQIDLYPNHFPLKERINQGNILAAKVYSKLLSGFNPYDIKVKHKIHTLTDMEILEKVVASKISKGVSNHYERQLKYTLNTLRKYTKNNIDGNVIKALLGRFDNATSYNTMRRSLIVLFNLGKEIGWKKDVISGIKPKKATAKLHKPIRNLVELLNEIKNYNSNLHLCCLLTYGCLLRPHREIRELKWGDFSEDLTSINLSGNRNKSGRNRIVPIPLYIKEVLKKNESHINIFSGTEHPFDPDYFKGIWGRFKKQTNLLEKDQTLYSFRHTGAIDIYRRTGSLEKLRTAMGHSSVMVSLTYLRGLGVTELKENDMPRLVDYSTD